MSDETKTCSTCKHAKDLGPMWRWRCWARCNAGNPGGSYPHWEQQSPPALRESNERVSDLTDLVTDSGEQRDKLRSSLAATMDHVDKLQARVAELEGIARERQEHALDLTQRCFSEARRRRTAEAEAESARAGEAAAMDLVDQLERGQEMLRDLLLAQQRCNEELRGELRRAPAGRYYGDVVIARHAADIARAEAECARAGEAGLLSSVDAILERADESYYAAESARAGESAALEDLAKLQRTHNLRGELIELVRGSESAALDELAEAREDASALGTECIDLQQELHATVAAHDERVVALLEEQLYCRDHAFDAAADALQDALRLVDPIDCDEAPRDLTPPRSCETCKLDGSLGCDPYACSRWPGIWQSRVEIVDAIEEE